MQTYNFFEEVSRKNLDYWEKEKISRKKYHFMHIAYGILNIYNIIVQGKQWFIKIQVWYKLLDFT